MGMILLIITLIKLLDKEGVIIRVSLGEERNLELKMTYGTVVCLFVLGPYTNHDFTHSILRKEWSSQLRIMLTFRRVLTFQRLVDCLERDYQLHLCPISRN